MLVIQYLQRTWRRFTELSEFLSILLFYFTIKLTEIGERKKEQVLGNSIYVIFIQSNHEY